ncbi:MAG TPA: hypothetical protein VF075_04515 [Pyrinomonadaceae bacterium]
MTLTYPIVTSMFMRAFQTQHPAFKRGLSLLLLAFIIYGTTVEAAHRHGQVLPEASQGTSLVDLSSTHGTFNTTPGCSDCLICQLHLNFSATLISVTPQAEQITRQTHLRTSVPVSIHSISSSPHSGRAPPQAN